MIFFDYDVEEDFDFDCERDVTKTIDYALESEEFPYDYEVNVLFTNNEHIHEINRENRDIDKPTDVLSFPAIDFSAPADYSVFDDENAAMLLTDPENDCMILGDIVISVEKAKAQAAEYGHSLRREICFLAAHSVFHLLGYDHETDDERVVMEEKQKRVLEVLGILR